MLRRVGRVLRVGLLALGLGLLLWLPVSYYSVARLQLPFPTARLEVSSSEGLLLVLSDRLRKSGHVDSPVKLEWVIDGDEFTPAMSRMCPHWSTVQGIHAVYTPLWLLAVLCLAWPLTSFLLHRRRQRRGFAVQAAPQPRGGGESQSPGQRPGSPATHRIEP